MKQPTIERIHYKSGYKYQLAEDYLFEIGILPKRYFDADFLSINMAGKLIIKKGYAWDGPSGPTYDFKCFMRGSLIHDAYYQLIRMGIVSIFYRKKADDILRDVCRNDGMWKWYAKLVWNAVRVFGGTRDRCKVERSIETAP